MKLGRSLNLSGNILRSDKNLGLALDPDSVRPWVTVWIPAVDHAPGQTNEFTPCPGGTLEHQCTGSREHFQVTPGLKAEQDEQEWACCWDDVIAERKARKCRREDTGPVKVGNWRREDTGPVEIGNRQREDAGPVEVGSWQREDAGSVEVRSCCQEEAGPMDTTSSEKEGMGPEGIGCWKKEAMGPE
ncbi:hypothetical protein NDU88_001825 [Pleurodeles waltl]|uniref:Uncharacterized protein n=1 Tax=Pleurodeles waltl TaxID=8319 RepID=A0AAV7UX26_PLEWA|nr:hypothetical protein NDU88_001825 [Pleurodeles waltl]